MKIYLYVNAFLYLTFSIWCLIKCYGSSKFLGYSFLNNSGQVEYLTIYTGLQLSFALFLGFAAYRPDFNLPALFFCVLLYGCIILTRTMSALFLKDLSNATFIVGALEYSLFIWGLIVLINELHK